MEDKPSIKELLSKENNEMKGVTYLFYFHNAISNSYSVDYES